MPPTPTARRLDNTAIFPALTGAGSAAGDLFYVFDVSAGVAKSITRAELKAAIEAQLGFAIGDVASYLPLAGGTLTAALVMSNAIWLNWKDSGGTSRNVLRLNSGGGLEINNSSGGTGGPIIVQANASEIARFDGNGLGVGTSPITATKLLVQGSLSVKSTDNNFGAGGNRGFMDQASGYVRMGAVNGGGSANGLALVVGAGVEALIINNTGSAVLAGTDNAIGMGGPSNRWSTVYAGTGTINTSGAAAKRNMRAPGAVERRVAARIKAGGLFYQFADAIDAKGAGAARLHFGVIAEDVAKAFRDEGLDPARYAMFCSDPVIRREAYEEIEERPKLETVEIEETRDDLVDGRLVRRTVRVSVERQVTELVPLFDESGAAILEPAAETSPVVATNGAPVVRMVPAMRPVPVMEKVAVEKFRDVETDEVRLGLRYDELTLFLLLAA